MQSRLVLLYCFLPSATTYIQNNLSFICMAVIACMFICSPFTRSKLKIQENVLESLELELQMALGYMWMPGSYPGSSEMAASAFNW